MAGKFTVVLRFDGDGRAAGLSVHRSQRERERERERARSGVTLKLDAPRVGEKRVETG